MATRLITAALAWLALAAGAAYAQGPGPQGPGIQGPGFQGQGPEVQGVQSPRAAPGAPVQTGHVELQLLSADTVAAPGEVAWVALRQTIAPGWHTYWRNSGDAGQPTQIVWTPARGASIGAPVWPTPRRLREASLMTYGYQGEVITPIPVRVARNVPPGAMLTLTARVDLLVCKDVCIPEGADLAIELPIGDAVEQDPIVGRKISDALVAAPKPAPFSAAAKVEDGVLQLAFTGPALKAFNPAGAYFFPYDPKALDQPSRQAVERGADGFTLAVKAGPGTASGLHGPVAGVLGVGGRAFEVSAKPGPIPAGASGLGAAAAADETAAPASAPAKPARPAVGFLPALALGLLGGVVLNLMPCVFPVLAIKAAALTRVASHGERQARVHGLAFAAGVILTFLVLAGGLIALRAAGQAAGWGFQLQSPPMIAGLTLLMLAVALNLSGVFEAGLSAQRAAGRVNVGDGVAGAFGTGVLAVLVAAPCTAPLMAVAVGYTLTASAPLALCVFAAMGLGLALPFLALSFSPKLLARLPRPGPWMETLRHVLAFPMYAAAGWLAWVFAHQVGVEPLGALLGAGVALAFALFVFGGAQRREAAGAASVLLGLLTAGVFTAVAVFLAAVAASAPVPPAGATVQASPAEQALSAEPYSAARLAELRSQGRQVFVNFTADWCLTCKVNEAVALSQPQVRAAFVKTHTAYLLGDWTRRDDVIARTLAEHGRAGVPLYLLYRPDAAEPEVLPQLLSPGGVAKALQPRASAQPAGPVRTASPSVASPVVAPSAPALGDRG